MKSYSVVIPTNKSANDIQPLLSSLAEQTLPAQEIIIVWDFKASAPELEVYKIAVSIPFGPLKNTSVKVIHTHTDKSFKPWQGVSYVRNYGRSKVKSKYTLFIDDDNIFDSSDSIQKLFAYTKSYNTDKSIVAPVQYRSSWPLRPSLAQWFSFALMRPRRLSSRSIALARRYFRLAMASSNCLLGKTRLFERYPFDENIPFVYEDLILTSSMTRDGIILLADTSVRTIHEDDKRSRISKMYLNNPERTYQKAKHRLLLLQALKPNSFQSLAYKALWLPGQTLYLAAHILLFAPKSDRAWLLQALKQGTKDGLKAISK